MNECVPIPPDHHGECVQLAKWVRTNVFEIEMHIVRQLGHIDKNKTCDSLKWVYMYNI